MAKGSPHDSHEEQGKEEKLPKDGSGKKGKAEKEKKEESPHKGHRERMKEKVQKMGLDDFPEHEVLEYVLFHAIPRIDTNPLAHALIERFGGFAQVLEASEEELREVEGVGPKTAQLLTMLPAVGRYYAQCKTRTSRFPKNDKDREAFIASIFHGQSNEQFWIIALGDRLQILRKVMLAEGGINMVSASINRIAAEAVSAGAAALVLAHNHPAGTAMPSAEDIPATARIMAALQPLNIQVLDHYIAAPDGVCSMRKRGNMPYFNSVTGEVCYIHDKQRRV